MFVDDDYLARVVLQGERNYTCDEFPYSDDDCSLQSTRKLSGVTHVFVL